MSHESDFPKLFLTPRLAQIARGAGVVGVDLNTTALIYVRRIVTNAMGDTGAIPPPPDRTSILLRWAGRWGISSDLRYPGAADTDLYLSAAALPEIGIDGAEAPPDTSHYWSKRHILVPERSIVQVDIHSLDDPCFGAELASGLIDEGREVATTPRAILNRCAEYLGAATEARNKAMYDAQRLYPNVLRFQMGPAQR